MDAMDACSHGRQVRDVASMGYRFYVYAISVEHGGQRMARIRNCSDTFFVLPFRFTEVLCRTDPFGARSGPESPTVLRVFLHRI